VNTAIPPDAAIGSDGQWEIVIEAGGRASSPFRLSTR
jgi:hypothetical protein